MEEHVEQPMVLTKGEFDRFWDEAIGKRWYIDEWYVDDRMFERLKPHETFELEVLELGWQGEDGSRPEPSEWISEHDLDGGRRTIINGLKILEKWRKAQPTVTVSFEVPVAVLADLVAFATECGASALGTLVPAQIEERSPTPS